MPDAPCPRCGAGTENLEHAFCNCPVVQEVWSLVDLQWVLSNLTLDWFTCLTWGFNMCLKAQHRVFCCTLWVIWIERNKRVHEHTNKSSTNIAYFILIYIEDLDSLQEKKEYQISKSSMGDSSEGSC